jgi:hypothetical protein
MRSPLPLAIVLGVGGFVWLAYVSATARPTKTSVAARPDKKTTAPGDPLAEPEPAPTPTPMAPVPPTPPPRAPVSVNRAAVKACMEKCLKADPKCGGTVVTTVTINATGKATKAVSESANAPTSLVECIRKSFLDMKYAPPEDGETTTVVVPVTLNASK